MSLIDLDDDGHGELSQTQQEQQRQAPLLPSSSSSPSSSYLEEAGGLSGSYLDGIPDSVVKQWFISADKDGDREVRSKGFYSAVQCMNYDPVCATHPFISKPTSLNAADG